MIGASRIGFDPALPWNVLYVLAGVALVTWLFYLWRGGGARILRLAGLVFLLIGLAQPQIVREAREAANDVALLIVDQSESLALAGRREAARAAGDAVAQRLAQLDSLEVRVREARGGPDGTLITGVMDDALSDLARDRVGAVIVVTDGQAADPPEDPRKYADRAPVQVLIVGDPNRNDRRLELISAPTFGIVGEPMRVSARVIDPAASGDIRVRISIDGRPVSEARVRANQPFNIDIRDIHRGRNMVIVEADAGPQEITLANNRAAFSANGVRDRLRVLLITGEPHPGARVWRNLLKSDPAVDLVHFTILRPPEKQDSTPLYDLALIQFPTEELFEQRLDEFDLIIFDRYRRRATVLQPYYFSNIARRVENGGALLIAAGEAEAGPDGVYRTPLAAILPSQPTGSLITRPYRPAPTALGSRHPVVRGLPSPERWGRWTRAIDARASGGQTVLQGDGRPLLVLDRAGRGRIAQLWSDQPWLWARGYDGGGPHGELLRRLAHWLMQEPELEDERLTLDPSPQGLSITRSTLGEAPGPVEVIAPNGARATAPLTQASPGVFRGQASAPQQGLYEARAGELRAFAAVGPLNPREAAALAADPNILRPLAQASGGAVMLTGEDGRRLPDIRRVARGERAAGPDWIGVRRNGAYTVRAAEATPLGPGWAWALFGVALLMLGWRREVR